MTELVSNRCRKPALWRVVRHTGGSYAVSMGNAALTAARAALGLSQDEMAAALRVAGVPGCTKRQVARLEAGEVRRPQAHTRRALQEVTGMSLAELGFEEDAAPGSLLGPVPASFPAN